MIKPLTFQHVGRYVISPEILPSKRGLRIIIDISFYEFIQGAYSYFYLLLNISVEGENRFFFYKYHYRYKSSSRHTPVSILSLIIHSIISAYKTLH